MNHITTNVLRDRESRRSHSQHRASVSARMCAQDSGARRPAQNHDERARPVARQGTPLRLPTGSLFPVVAGRAADFKPLVGRQKIQQRGQLLGYVKT